MIRPLFISMLILFLNSFLLQGQVLDLIVSTKGDSIVCKIDSLSKKDIHFKFKQGNKWLTTFLPLDDIKSYEYEAINLRYYRIRNGKIIKSYPGDSVLVSSLNKYSIGFELFTFFPSLFFEWKLYNKERQGILVNAGLVGNAAPELLLMGGEYIAGGPRHYFSIGINLAFDLSFYDLRPIAIPKAGYRYEGNQSFVFRANVNLVYTLPVPSISIGYRF